MTALQSPRYSGGNAHHGFLRKCVVQFIATAAVAIALPCRSWGIPVYGYLWMLVPCLCTYVHTTNCLCTKLTAGARHLDAHAREQKSELAILPDTVSHAVPWGPGCLPVSKKRQQNREPEGESWSQCSSFYSLVLCTSYLRNAAIGWLLKLG